MGTKQKPVMTKTVQKAYCPGSGSPIPKKGFKTKYIRYEIKYLCPECGGYFAMKADRTLNKHGYALRLTDGSRIDTVSYCAECGDTIPGVDFLCAKCRENS